MGFGDSLRGKLRQVFGPKSSSVGGGSDIVSKEELRQAMREVSRTPMEGDLAEFEGLMNWYESKTSVERGLTSRYSDYESMDDYPDFSAALDTWADESTQPDQMKKVSIWVESNNHGVASRGNELLDKLEVDRDIWGLSRGVAKYGNQFGELLLGEDGVEGVRYLDSPTVRAVSKGDKVLGYIQSPSGKFDIPVDVFEKALEEGQYLIGDIALYEPFEMVHWKLMLRRLRGLYGHGIGEPVRWLHKRLIMLEDLFILHKIARTPVRFGYYVSCGDIPAEKRMAYVKQVKSLYKRKMYKSADGKLNFSFNPLNPMEEIWLPSGGGNGDTRIETIGGSDFQSMELLQYFQNKYHMALKVPRSFLGMDGITSQTALSQQDVRFARAILRLQNGLCHGFDYVIGVDLEIRNIDPRSVRYGTRMTTPSSIFELARMEVWNSRADLMGRIGEFMPMVWMLLNIVGLSEDEAAQVIALKQYEKRVIALWDSKTAADSEKIQSGAGSEAFEQMASRGYGGDDGGDGVEQESIRRGHIRFTNKVVESERRSGLVRFDSGDQRRVLDKVNKLLESDSDLRSRMENLRGMIREIYVATNSRGSGRR